MVNREKKKIPHEPLTINYKRSFSTNKRSFSTNKRAFTLIELLVVIAIIAVLAGAILYSTDNARVRGRDQVRKEDLKSLNSALVSYWTDNKSYPPTDPNDDQRDFASDSADPNTWIPNLTPYIEKTPKDPQQASAGRVAGVDTINVKVSSSADDGKQVREDAPPWDFQNNVTDNPVGHPFVCPGSVYYPPTQTRDSFMRFQNVAIPQGATIESAKLIFTPRNDSSSNEDESANATSPSYIKTRLRVELDPNPAIITSRADMDGRTKTADADAVSWDDIPVWYPTPTNPDDLTSPELKTLIQPLIDLGAWNSGNSLIIFWEDNGSTAGSFPNCGGRVPNSYDGQLAGLGSAPELTITYNTSIIIIPPEPDERGACDNKDGIYCLRVSDNKKAYVLWAQLENINDREKANNANAICNFSDPDFTDPGSPFNGLGRPQNAGIGLNYCIKSTQ